MIDKATEHINRQQNTIEKQKKRLSFMNNDSIFIELPENMIETVPKLTVKEFNEKLLPYMTRHNLRYSAAKLMEFCGLVRNRLFPTYPI